MLNNWLKISLKAFKSKDDFFEEKSNKFEFKVFKFEGTNNGFMIIWNIKTLNAFTVSRMKVGKNILVDVIDVDSENRDSLNKLGYLPENLVFEGASPY
ncbi:hypothetical protein [Pontimicrobium sp. MEBiC06410]